MTIVHEERGSDSPYIESVTRGRTLSTGSTIRPAEIHWHLVFVKVNGQTLAIAVGPLTTAGVVSYGEGAEILWVKFKLGTFMPHLPFKHYLNVETIMPEAVGQSFWLHGSAWEIPDFENVETFVDRLAREDALAHDSVVRSVLSGQPSEASARTVRHRFQHATGLTQNHIHQVERALQAASRLRHGLSILDTVNELGYYDQPMHKLDIATLQRAYDGQ
jgi:hypothetical protein